MGVLECSRTVALTEREKLTITGKDGSDAGLSPVCIDRNVYQVGDDQAEARRQPFQHQSHTILTVVATKVAFIALG